MSAQVVQLMAAVLLVAGGWAVLRWRDAVAREISEWNKFQYDRRATLYDLDRAERLKQIYEAGPADRLVAVLLGLLLILAGTGLIAGAIV